MSWHLERMTAFDLETTTAEREEARIVTGCVVELGGGQETVPHTWIADPGVEIPEQAARIHGFTTERAQAEGRPEVEVVDEILCSLASTALGRPLVIFNAPYDLTVLDRRARAHGLEPLQDRIPLLVVCPRTIDKFLDRYRRGRRKLIDVCEIYGARLDGAHDATFDAIACARVAYMQSAKGRVIRRYAHEREVLTAEWEAVRGDLELLHAAQVRWWAEQAHGLRDHMHGKWLAEPEETRDPEPPHVDPYWPLTPVEAVAA